MKKGIIINSDCDGALWYIGRDDALPTTAQDIIDFAKDFGGSGVTDYFINVAADTLAFPSDKYENILDKYYQKIENGEPVDYTNNIIKKSAHIVYEELRLDPNALMMQGFREVGINPWLSFRMNDFHERRPEIKTSACFSNFYHEHPEYYLCHLPPRFAATFRDRAYNYAIEAVREHFLGLIEESLERYDCYGIELDFQREACLFPYGMEYDGVEIMNVFMRKVKELLQKFEVKYGHELKCAVRVPSEIQTCFDFGMDVVQWVREGLVNVVIPTSRWATTDFDIPVKLWANLIKPFGAILAPGVEYRIMPCDDSEMVTHNIETFAAFAANAYAQGADRIYYYNFFRSNLHERFNKTTDYDTDPTKPIQNLDIYWSFINIMADPDLVQKVNRRHIVSFKDKLAPWERTYPVLQIPAVIDRTCGFKLFVGDIPEDAELTLKIGVKETEKAIADPPWIFVNECECPYTGTFEDDRFAKGTVLCYTIPKEVHSKMICPRVGVTETTEIRYVEVFVKVQ